MSDKNNQHDPIETNLPPGLAQPALRALTAAGYLRLEQISSLSETELKRLHGIGPKAIDQLRRALAARGLTFRGENKNHA